MQITIFSYGLIKIFNFQGADIDIRVVRDGRGPDCNVWSNFKQVNVLYEIEFLGCNVLFLSLLLNIKCHQHSNNMHMMMNCM